MQCVTISRSCSTLSLLLAGHVDQLMYRIWSCLGRYDKARGVQLLRKRNTNEESATMRSLRPDLLVSFQGALLFKGEDKTESNEIYQAMSQLTEKLKSWGAAVQDKVGAAKFCLLQVLQSDAECQATSVSLNSQLCVQVEYLLSYACAGPQLQICALQPHGQQAVRVGHPHAIHTLQGKLNLIVVVVHLYAILKAQVQQLPISFLQLGYTRQTTFSSIEYLDGFVRKRVASLDAWPAERTDFMTRVYRDIVGCPYLIQASNAPKKWGRNSECAVHLAPIGLPMGHGTTLTDQAGLKTCIR